MEYLSLRAAEFAERVHGEQKRKYTGEPYFAHLREVATLLMEAGMSEELIAAGYLHDTLEDTATTLDELRDNFGPEVAQLVYEVTDVSKPEDGNRERRKEIDRQHLAQSSPDGATLKLADLISNTRSISQHDKAFAKVYLKEKSKLLDVLQHGADPLWDLAVKTLSRAMIAIQQQEMGVS
jgi:(p)ppGpp synthase/HD superfamily hydrolase